jgi:hypothetical protein
MNTILNWKEWQKSFESVDNNLKLATGEPVILIHVHKGVKEYLKDALIQIKGGDKFIKKTIEFDKPIGLKYCVEVDDNDKIYFKQRKGRKGKSKMVFNREPEPSNKLTLILLKKSNYYLLLTSYIGDQSEPEPWDDNAKDKQKSIEYWKNHALIQENKSYTFKDLENILLSNSGDKVLEIYEEDLKELIENGEFFGDFDADIQLIEMTPSKCHRNCAEFYKNFMDEHNSPDELFIITGWALLDGLWIQHSWLYSPFDNIIIETTVKRDNYYGYFLKGQKLEDFLFLNY